MVLRLVDIKTHEGHVDTIEAIADCPTVIDRVVAPTTTDGIVSVRLLTRSRGRQKLLDELQRALEPSEGWRLTLIPVEASMPVVKEDETEAEAEPRKIADFGMTREELMDDVRGGATFDVNYVVLVVLSTIVAAIGLLTDSVPVVIGAMVIAPLLGPNLALSFGVAIGDQALLLRAVATGVGGLGIAIVLSILIGLAWPSPVETHEILARTHVGYASIVLALASGAAAALSLTSGLSAALVGVMVAVALLPPTAAFGLLLGQAQGSLAFGAGLLLLTNVVCVNLAAQLIFLWKRVNPRRFSDREAAARARRITIAGWIFILALLTLVITLAPGSWPGH